MLNLLATVSTVKLIPLLARPPTVTTTFPVEDPSGTVATIDVSLQLTTKAGVPLNVTVLDPWDEPKFDPEIVTAAPTNPEVGDRLVMLGVVVVTIVKLTPLLALLPAVTTTFPDEAPNCTLATIDESLQLTTEAVVPWNVTVPAAEAKFVPEIVTDAPTAPEVGDMLVMVGVAGVVVVADV